MLNKKDSSTIIHIWTTAFLAGVISMLLFSSVFLSSVSPIMIYLGVIFVPFSVLPIALMVLKYGAPLGFFALACGVGIGMFLFGNVVFPFYLWFVGTISLTVGLGFRTGYRPEQVILSAAGLVLLIGISAVVVMASHHQIPLEDYYHSLVAHWIDTHSDLRQQIQELAESPQASEELKRLAEEPDRLVELIKVELVPAFFLVSLGASWMVGVFLSRFIKRVAGFSPWGERFFLRWKTPSFLVWVVIALGGWWVFDSEGSQWLIYPVFRCLILVYFFQGLSIVAFLFHRYRVNMLLRFIGFFVATLFALPGIAAVGFFDYWWEIREKITRKGLKKKKNGDTDRQG